MSGFDIAIIAMSGRYSRCGSTDELWTALVDGRELNVDADSPVPDGHIPRVPEVPGVAEFDHKFFGMSPAEASLVDPQQRVMLTCAFEALENAGAADGQERRWGVFASTSFSTYLLNNIMVARPDLVTDANMLAMIGNIPDSAATRLAYKLNLVGPAMTVQTACSSSLVALQVACRSLLDYECDGAMVAACSLTVPQKATRRHAEGSIFSADGYCRPFDEMGAGTIKGNGCTVVVLKRLEDAQTNHDHVLAVIDSIAVNNDGHDKVGYTAPSVLGEEEVIREALSIAELRPADIDYIETHGTGTELGDPIEIRALERVFGGQAKGLVVGSIKANIGHLDCAAGLTALVKVTRMLQTSTIPPLINFTSINSEIDNSRGTFDFCPTLETDRPMKHVGISSFGIGGTNAHMIVSSWPQQEDRSTRRKGLAALASISTIRAEDLQMREADIRSVVEAGADTWDAAYTAVKNDRGLRHRGMVLLGVGPVGDVDIDDVAPFVDPNSPVLLPLLDVCVRTLRSSNYYSSDLCRESLRLLLAVVAPSDPRVDDPELARLASRIRDDLPAPYEDAWLGAEGTKQQEALARLLALVSQARGDKCLAPLFAGTGARLVNLPHQRMAPTVHWVGPEDLQPTFPSRTPMLKRKPVAHVGTILEEVMLVISDVLAVNVTADSDFFALGGDSLQAIDVVDRLRAQHPELTLDIMLQAGTPRRLAEILSDDQPHVAMGQFPSNFTLVRNDGGPWETPVFMIHPAGGTIFQYRAMSVLMDSPSCLVGISLPEEYQEFDTLGSLARHYAEQIDSCWPEGEIRLAGYSAGGNLAVETGTILAQLGRKVAQLCLIDSLPPASYTRSDLGEQIPKGIVMYLLRALDIDEDDVREGLLDDGDITKLLVSRGVSPQESQGIVDKWLMGHRMLSYDPPEKFPGDAFVVSAEESMPADSLTEMGIVELPRTLWADQIEGTCTTIKVPGNHMSMMYGENLFRVAREVDAWIGRLIEEGH